MLALGEGALGCSLVRASSSTSLGAPGLPRAAAREGHPGELRTRSRGWLAPPFSPDPFYWAGLGKAGSRSGAARRRVALGVDQASRARRMSGCHVSPREHTGEWHMPAPAGPERVHHTSSGEKRRCRAAGNGSFPSRSRFGWVFTSFGGTDPSGCHEPAHHVAEQRPEGQISANFFFFLPNSVPGTFKSSHQGRSCQSCFCLCSKQEKLLQSSCFAGLEGRGVSASSLPLAAGHPRHLHIFLSPFPGVLGSETNLKMQLTPLHRFKADLEIWSPGSCVWSCWMSCWGWMSRKGGGRKTG